MNKAYGVTVEWLHELSPTSDAQQAAYDIFVQQTSEEPTFFENAERTVWGWISANASLLFKVPT